MGSRGQSRAEPSDLRLPDRYRVRRRLATGGMASVWCADDLVLGRTVAVKVLAERFAHDDMAMRRFKREARAAARVSTHAHVVTIYDVGDLEVDDRDVDSTARPFIVMEYLAGGTVADAIRVGAVRRQEAVRWIREAASALDHAHARGIVHRDIKPANFLLNRSRVLHVADFGIARLVSEDTITSTGELFGTAAYLSPEQALGGEATGASDRYALTVAAFELLAGERPFQAQHFAAQARQHIEEEPPFASDRDRTLPPAVDDVLMRGMAKEPDERFETAGAFVDALETALSGGVAVTTQRLTPQRRRTHAPGAFLGVPAMGGGNGGGGNELGAPARTRGTGSWHPPALGHPRHATSDAPNWTAGTSIQRGASRRRSGRIIALIALLLVIGGVGTVALAGLSGGSGSGKKTAARSATHAAHSAHPRPTRAHHKAATTAATTPSASTTPTTPTTPAAPTPPNAQQLQLTGHNEMLAGNYPEAIATLRKALAAADHHSLTYAYGLYDLGVALLRSGNAAAAVPVLEQRAKFPDQTAVVQATLQQALQASGQGQTSASPPSNGNGNGQGQAHGRGAGHHKHPGSSGGAGLPPGAAGTDEHANFID
ncbi:MAG TPA: serine/threonine-protein kinase [Solirubrobacteraceae bacterium]|nr:serine/threonine-protein kinase [Solirubrobacteraceae bacterium]